MTMETDLLHFKARLATLLAFLLYFGLWLLNVNIHFIGHGLYVCGGEIEDGKRAGCGDKERGTSQLPA